MKTSAQQNMKQGRNQVPKSWREVPAGMRAQKEFARILWTCHVRVFVGVSSLICTKNEAVPMRCAGKKCQALSIHVYKKRARSRLKREQEIIQHTNFWAAAPVNFSFPLLHYSAHLYLIAAAAVVVLVLLISIHEVTRNFSFSCSTTCATLHAFSCRAASLCCIIWKYESNTRH